MTHGVPSFGRHQVNSKHPFPPKPQNGWAAIFYSGPTNKSCSVLREMAGLDGIGFWRKRYGFFITSCGQNTIEMISLNLGLRCATPQAIVFRPFRAGIVGVILKYTCLSKGISNSDWEGICRIDRKTESIISGFWRERLAFSTTSAAKTENLKKQSILPIYVPQRGRK